MVNLIRLSAGGVNEAEYSKILLSDVMVTRKRNLFMGRNWRTLDIKMAIGILSIHLLALCAPFYFTWGAFWAAFITYVLCGILGVTLSYHRNLAHHSLKLPKWLEYTFAYFGVLSLQRDPIFWVSMHRYHHQYVDSDKDPHSPTFGFWFSHMGWLFDSGYLLEKYQERKNVEDLKNQAFYRFIKKTYLCHTFAFATTVYALGGFTYLVWVVAVLGSVALPLHIPITNFRGNPNISGENPCLHPESIFAHIRGVAITWGYHVTFLVNSACHIWGKQAWNTGDLSKNNWLVALITFGEGWHNNHHAFEYSARHGLEWWQIDFCWYMIRFLEVVGLATNVKLPTANHKSKKSFASSKK